MQNRDRGRIGNCASADRLTPFHNKLKSAEPIGRDRRAGLSLESPLRRIMGRLSRRLVTCRPHPRGPRTGRLGTDQSMGLSQCPGLYALSTAPSRLHGCCGCCGGCGASCTADRKKVIHQHAKETDVHDEPNHAQDKVTEMSSKKI